MTDTSVFPENLKYTREHEWVDASDPATVGITANAADALGDIVYVELPEVGREISAGEVIGEIESTKSVSELFAPVTGTVVAINDAVVADPGVVNRSAYDEGWLIKVNVQAADDLLSAEEYAATVE